MATKHILIKYDEQDGLAKKTIAFLRSLGVFEIEESIPALDKSLQEAKEGKVNTYNSVEELFKRIS